MSSSTKARRERRKRTAKQKWIHTRTNWFIGLPELVTYKIFEYVSQPYMYSSLCKHIQWVITPLIVDYIIEHVPVFRANKNFIKQKILPRLLGGNADCSYDIVYEVNSVQYWMEKALDITKDKEDSYVEFYLDEIVILSDTYTPLSDHSIQKEYDEGLLVHMGSSRSMVLNGDIKVLGSVISSYENEYLVLLGKYPKKIECKSGSVIIPSAGGGHFQMWIPYTRISERNFIRFFKMIMRGKCRFSYHKNYVRDILNYTKTENFVDAIFALHKEILWRTRIEFDQHYVHAAILEKMTYRPDKILTP